MVGSLNKQRGATLEMERNSTNFQSTQVDVNVEIMENLNIELSCCCMMENQDLNYYYFWQIGEFQAKLESIGPLFHVLAQNMVSHAVMAHRAAAKARPGQAKSCRDL